MNFWLTVPAEISESRLCLESDVHPLHVVMCILLRWESKDWILLEKVMKKTPVDLQKRFPIYHACPKCLATYHCSSAFSQDGLASRQWSRKGGSNTGRLVTWDSPLRTDSASLKLSRIIQTINFILEFLNSGREFINSVLIFDQSSSRKFIESWPLNSLQFFHLMKTSYELHEDPDFVLTIVHGEVIDLAWIAHTLL